MHNVNWWLMALSFLLGLLLTLVMMIRKVTREVPESHTVAANLRGAVDAPKVKAPEVKAPDLGKVAAAGAAVATGAAAKLHGAADKVEKKVEAGAHKLGATVEKTVEKVEAKAEHVLEHDPYGKGSIRVVRGTAAPAGYTIKGDKDTGRYFTLDAPDYDEVEAEVWFANEESAEKADFIRWNAKAGEHHDPGAEASHFVVKGGTTTPDSAKIVVTGGTTVPTGTAAVVHESHSDAKTTIHETHADASATAARIVSVDDVPAGPHGRGTIKAYADGTGPAGWAVKGNENSMLYHTVDSPNYEQTIAEVWFVDEETARRAGFKRWDSNQ